MSPAREMILTQSHAQLVQKVDYEYNQLKTAVPSWKSKKKADSDVSGVITLAGNEPRELCFPTLASVSNTHPYHAYL